MVKLTHYRSAEKAHVARRGDRRLVLFPSRPYWLAVDGPIEPALSLLERGATFDELVEACVGGPDEARVDAIQFVGELLGLLGRAGVVSGGDLVRGVPTLSIGARLLPTEDVCTIALTMECNLTCGHCFIDAGHAAPDELNLEEVCDLVDQLAADFRPLPGVQAFVHLTGGEPLLRRDLEPILAHIRRNGFFVSMSTNALLADDRIVGVLGKYEVCCSVSLDGASAATHERTRGSGTFEPTVAAIRRMVAGGVRVSINHFVHRENVFELGAVLELARSLNVEGFNPIALEHLGRAKDSGAFRAVPEAEIYRALLAYARTRPWVFELLRYSSAMANMIVALQAGIKARYCGVGSRRTLFVQSNGDVFACPNACHGDLRVGNVRTDRLAELFASSPVLQRMRQLDVDSMNPACAQCPFRFLCGGDCRGEVYANKRSLLSPSVSCSRRRDAILEALWIAAELPELYREQADECVARARLLGEPAAGK